MFEALYGTAFVETSAKAVYELIIRPHPQSLKVEIDYIRTLQDYLNEYNNIQRDFAVDSSSFMQTAVVLISDTSSVGGDFLCIYQKPFITLPVPFENMQEFEIEDLKTSWKEEVLAKIGYTVKDDEIEKNEQIVYFLIANHKKEI